jgi:hypothetical protein
MQELNMKKIIILLLVLSILSAVSSFAQTIGEPDAMAIGVDTAQQKLKEVSISKFEDAGFWKVAMPMDMGIISLRRHEGGPADKLPLEDEGDIGIEETDEYVIGVKTEYFRRGPSNFSIEPIRPLPVEGIAKTISVWVVGRNYNHMLRLVVEDYFGNRADLTMGKLNFSGWKKLTVAIPPNIVQRDPHYNNRMGIKILGFLVECDIIETYGTYYIYFDDLRAVTDLFAESARDEDDMPDNW